MEPRTFYKKLALSRFRLGAFLHLSQFPLMFISAVDKRKGKLGLAFEKGESVTEERLEPWENESQKLEFEDYAMKYRPEEMTILVLTNQDVFGGANYGRTGLQLGMILLNAWTEEGNPKIHREEFWLNALATRKMLNLYTRRTPENSILTCRVRPLADETGTRRFLLADAPEPAAHPKLEAILKRRNKPVVLNVEGLGTFTLDRKNDWFQGRIDWLGRPVQLTFDRGGPKKREAAQETARALLAAAADWDRRVRAYAAAELTESVSLIQDMGLDAVQVDHKGGFDFWFEDCPSLGGHSLHVAGTLTGGPDFAGMEG